MKLLLSQHQINDLVHISDVYIAIASHIAISCRSLAEHGINNSIDIGDIY